MPEWEGAKVPVPDGVHPLFLTMTTQTNFKCRERGECTSEKPYVFVSKKFFLDDIQFRGVISDFHPTKKFIEKYPDDTDVQEDGTSGLLIVWDEEEDYGQNFYLVHKVRRLAGAKSARLGPSTSSAGASPYRPPPLPYRMHSRMRSSPSSRPRLPRSRAARAAAAARAARVAARAARRRRRWRNTWRRCPSRGSRSVARPRLRRRQWCSRDAGIELWIDSDSISPSGRSSEEVVLRLLIVLDMLSPFRGSGGAPPVVKGAL